jgi:Ca2+-binding RTX toxin-like protein
MDADGSQQTRLTDHPAIDAIPVWAPSGDQLLFTSDRAGRDRRGLYVLDASGQNIRALPAENAVQGDWQPLGARPAGCTIWGTGGNDLLPGTKGRDVVCGLGGNDRVDAGSGADVLRGGPGRDVLMAGAGADTIDARDRTRDDVNGGVGLDEARVDRGLDRLVAVERVRSS